MKWTEAQERVIKERNCNLLVSAAAGSGKTAVLVERIIERLCDDTDKISLDRLLVMTFTKAAAEEMRERIGKAISERLKAEPENKDLLLQKTLLPRAKISTIDSICQNLIKQHYQYLEIDPGFRVPDEGELNLLKDDIVSEMIEEYYDAEDSRFNDFAEAFGGNGTDGRLSEIILSNANILNSNPWPELTLEEQLSECRKEQNGDFEDTEWFKFLMEDVRNFTKEHVERLEYAREFCYEADGPMPYLENIDELLEIGEDILASKTYDDLYNVLIEYAPSRLKIVRGKKYDTSLKELVKKYIDDFKTYIKEKLKPTYAVLSAEDVSFAVAEAAFSNEIVLRLAGEFNRRFERKKREKNLVDFSDMEHLALKLLYENKDGKMVPGKIADMLSEQFDEILIDEYQDSNFVQEALIQALSAERFGRPDVFMVGDVKQSIYRFRLAKPELFMDKYASYKDSGKNIKIELNQNFRSREEVISSVNSIFRCIMRKELGGVEYDDNQSLKLGASYPASSGNETELCIINTKSAEDDSNADKDSYEAKYIADRINQLVGKSRIDDGRSAFMVTDKQSGKLRPASYGDIVILMRAPGKRAEKYARELSYVGIPVYYENSKGYFDAPEIEIILSYLNIIDNPNQDIPLTAALRSMIGGLSDSELAYIRSTYNLSTEENTAGAGNMYEALVYCADEWKATDERGSVIKDKCISFLSKLDLYRKLSSFLPVHVLLYRIYRETGYYECMSAMPLGKLRRKNLDMLLKRAESYSKTSLHGLFSFVRYIERLRENKADYGAARVVSDNDDIVRIVSIHKSKGLEYPIVFLSGMGKQFNRQDLNEKIVTEGDIGVASDFYDLENRIKYPVLKKDAIKRKKYLDDLGEELRVLYVAMTRAKEKLIMTAAIPNPETKLKKLSVELPEDKFSVGVISSAHSYLDWVLMSSSGQNTDIDIKLIDRREVELTEGDEEKLNNNYYEAAEKIPSSALINDSFVNHIRN
ncbi:MAG: helicase-exonuclease AddAB subunit AddA, partial [Eubacteriales bacterium]|nr:helicase-exonuclease AddAB subunit AddA [Eubacteriales bacterium]